MNSTAIPSMRFDTPPHRNPVIPQKAAGESDSPSIYGD
jgi:hypothetical protein